MMEALDLSCLHTGVQRHSAALQRAGNLTTCSASYGSATFPLPEVDDVSPAEDDVIACTCVNMYSGRSHWSYYLKPKLSIHFG